MDNLSLIQQTQKTNSIFVVCLVVKLNHIVVTLTTLLSHLPQLVLGQLEETLGLAAVLMVTVEDVVLHLRCSLVAVDSLDLPKAVNAGVTGAVVAS